ncbi:hypothetical protein OIO90_005586 [Microbotryomycetes sp. JL221]|nr:hypothetical protein OIO90_005586 [Microbotryomycetes sp. JL221]
MEAILSDTKLHDELDFVKRQADMLATQRLKYPSTYVPPIEHRQKKPTLVDIAVVEPPAPMEQDDAQAAAANDAITLTIKSLKPALTFTLACAPTATISSLKSQLSSAHNDAPAPESQRWILKGKAMSGERLLKEFAVENGSVVNLMITKSTATPAAAAGSTSTSVPVSTPSPTSVPSLTLSEPVPVSSGPPTLQINTTSLPIDDGSLTPSAPPQFNIKISDPTLWIGAWELLRRHFGEENEADAQRAWEAWLGGAREWISPSDKALIRDRVGLSAMGGL